MRIGTKPRAAWSGSSPRAAWLKCRRRRSPDTSRKKSPRQSRPRRRLRLQLLQSPQLRIPQTPEDLAAQAAKKYLLPDSFVRSVMKAESGFQPNAVSPKGAIGLMQLMPETARMLGVDPRDPHQNAEGGAQYLRELLARYEGDPDQVLLALAAYNAGPGAVDRYHGVPPYRETREYILRVLKNWDQSPK